MSLDLDLFLRGAAWSGTDAVAYPRADPADASRLPGDTWGVAQLPVGVRLELVGDAAAIEIDYTCLTGDLGYRGPGAGSTFALWRGDEKLAEAPASKGDGTATLPLPASGDEPLVVHLPEGMKPRLRELRAVDGTIAPAPAGPRWLAYGDSITEGWIASEPGMAWPSIAARRFRLDLVNLGYAGAARGEIASAEQLAALPSPDVISVFYGTNCWTRTPHSAELLVAGLRAFMAIVRQGHPDVPIVVVSMILRPDAEGQPNRLGATMADLRQAVEQTAEALDDPRLQLVRGGDLVAADQLPDGIHPGDDAQRVLADVIGRRVAAAAGAAVV